MIAISSPLFPGCPTIVRALYAPMPNRTSAVVPTDTHMLDPTGSTANGTSGTRDPTTAESPTTSAARTACRRSTGLN